MTLIVAHSTNFLQLGLKECRNPDPRPGASYLTAPNDVWSLGVILVNLTCGRNPWKEASADDAVFRAYLEDPFFLQTILPLTNRITYILSRVFEIDPSKRITLPELRNMVADCPSFAEVPNSSQNLAGRQPQTLPESLEGPVPSLCPPPDYSAWGMSPENPN